jgi:hypothetical protein
MPVYLKTAGRIYNLSITTPITETYDGVLLGTEKIWCKELEVTHMILEDISKALEAEALTGKGAYLKVFVSDGEEQDKYSLKRNEIQEQERERIKNRKVQQVMDVLEKQAYRYFDVKFTLIGKHGRTLSTPSFKETVLAKDEETVEAWVWRKTYGKKSDDDFVNLVEDSLVIKEDLRMAVYACQKQLPETYTFQRLEILDYAEFAEKETK